MEENIIKIGSLNIQNSVINRKNKKLSKILSDNIINEQFDIIGTQELTKTITKSMKKLVNPYKIFGKHRFGNTLLINLIPFISYFNENNSIITRLNVIKTKTIRLPWNFNSIPRIATIIISKLNDKDSICIINTHLDHHSKSVKIKQLEYLEKVIHKYANKYHIILTGDFNSTVKNKHFNKLMVTLDKLEIYRIPIDTSSHINHADPIDHIFVSKTFEVLEKGIIENQILNSITDHKGIYAKIKLNIQKDID